MDKVKLTTWKLNDKQQIEADIEGNRHLSREEVGRRVVLLAGETVFELGLFAIGLFLHDDGKPSDGAAKLIPLPGSSLTLKEVVKALNVTGDNYLIVQNQPAAEPSKHFQDPLVQLKSEKSDKS